MADRLPPAWRAWLAAVVALILLNASLTFQNVWPTPKIRLGHFLSVELAVTVLILTAAWRWTGWLTRRVLPVVWLVLVAGRYLDVTAPGLYGRPFNIYWDGPHLGNVAAMLTQSAAWWQLLAGAGMLVLALALAFAAARVTFAWLGLALACPAVRRTAGVLAAAVCAIYVVQYPGPSEPTEGAFADPVSVGYAKQARFAAALLGPAAVVPVLAESPALDGNLAGLSGVDVLLLFVESYGAVTFDVPEMAARLSPARSDLEQAIRQTDRAVVSAFVESPTFGGSSWLAHLSLLSGVEVRDQYAYTALMASSRDTLVKHFSRGGYRTVAIMPGMRQPWPEGSFYGFDTIYGHDRLEYGGPQWAWWDIPDQFALARLDVIERARRPRDPLFVVFPTSTTHAPFGPVAPYVTDWPRVLDANAWDPREVDAVMSIEPEWTNLRPNYLQAVQYEYTSFAGYLRQHPADDMVMILIGDHQPPAAVSGTDAPWLVPVHVIGREPILHALQRHGFRPGLTPQRPSLGAMHTLVPMLLDVFAGSGAAPVGSSAQLRD